MVSFSTVRKLGRQRAGNLSGGQEGDRLMVCGRPLVAVNTGFGPTKLLLVKSNPTHVAKHLQFDFLLLIGFCDNVPRLEFLAAETFGQHKLFLHKYKLYWCSLKSSVRQLDVNFLNEDV